MTTQTNEIDYAHEAHLSFMARQVFDIGGGELVSFEEWVEWQTSRDPFLDDPAEAQRLSDNFLLDIQAERRGPGISRRPRPDKTTGGRKDA